MVVSSPFLFLEVYYCKKKKKSSYQMCFVVLFLEPENKSLSNCSVTIDSYGLHCCPDTFWTGDGWVSIHTHLLLWLRYVVLWHKGMKQTIYDSYYDRYFKKWYEYVFVRVFLGNRPVVLVNLWRIWTRICFKLATPTDAESAAPSTWSYWVSSCLQTHIVLNVF